MNYNMTSQEIEKICFIHHINKYTINEDELGFYVDVNGTVVLSYHDLSDIPVRFGTVSGNFDCFYNNLTSLEWCPINVGGDLYISHNQITSLKHCPKSVGGSLICTNNELPSLESSPIEVGLHFGCSHNRLTSLYGAPKSVGGTFYCYQNKWEIDKDSISHLFDLGYEIIDFGSRYDLVSLKRQWILKNIIND